MKFYSVPLLLYVAIVQVQAFCVYNKASHHSVRITQNKYHTNANDMTSFKSEYFDINGKACCPYTDTDCSWSGAREEMISVNIDVDNISIYTVSMQAGGYVEVYDGDDQDHKKVKIITYTPNGQVVPCSQIDPPAFDKRTSTGAHYDDCPYDI